MSELKYNEPAERFAPSVEKSLYANATAVMVSSEDGCWVHYAKYCERIFNIKSELGKIIAYHKYKRCLGMAKWCNEVMMSCELRSYTVNRIWYNRHQWAMRWKYKWLEIAEKFKEGV